VARPNVLVDPVGPTLLRLAGPMTIGIASIILFNVVDTFWVGQLGDTRLAAMSFTFPVVSVIMSLSMGLGIGTTSVVSRAIGQGDQAKVRRLTTDSLMLSVLLVVTFAVTGLLTIDPLFSALGAEPDTVVLIRQYMVPWYLGIGLIVVPMVGNSAIRATGDTKTPSLIMMIAGFVNMAFDPFLIFGIGPFPRLELRGAAISTVLSFGTTTLAALWLLGPRLHMLDGVQLRLSKLWSSWRQIIFIGLPASAANMLVPLSAGIITRILAGYGHEAVAGYGVSTRIESFTMVGIGALSSSIAPFVGQNYGARQHERIRAAISFAFRSSMVFGAVLAGMLALLGPHIAALFSDSPDVIDVAASYMRIVPVGYGALGVCMLASSSFNAVNRPLAASAIIAMRLFVFAVPLAIFGSRWFGVPGVFAGIIIGNLGMGLIAGHVARIGFAAEVAGR
jgi:putative MATE family efflux protein